MASAPHPAKASISQQRILILSPTRQNGETAAYPSPFSDLLEALTGSRPSEDITSFSGYTSHVPIRIRTKYYESDVGIWCDELPRCLPSLPQQNSAADAEPSRIAITPKSKQDEETSQQSLQDWKDQMLSTEAAEVRSAVGGIVLVLPFPLGGTSVKDTSKMVDDYMVYVKAAEELRDAVEDARSGSDVAVVILLQKVSGKKELIGVSQTAVLEKLEDTCLSQEGILGWDFVSWDGLMKNDSLNERDVDRSLQTTSRNEYGEKVGIDRVLEVLEGIDWTASPDIAADEDMDDLLDGEQEEDNVLDMLGSRRFHSSGSADAGFQQEFRDLKMAMLDPSGDRDPGSDNVENDGQEHQVDQLQALMSRVMAMREAGMEMSKDEREKFARREVNRLMKDVDLG